MLDGEYWFLGTHGTEGEINKSLLRGRVGIRASSL